MNQSSHPSRALPTPNHAWHAAHANLKLAEARFAPVQAALWQVERVYFAQDSDKRANTQMADAELVEAQLERAYEEERVFGTALDKAAKRLSQTRAPDIAALIEKVELLTKLGCDDSITDWIVSDLRHLQARDRPG